jgi:hypothetical protein|tara:strand:+ start:1689 stop:2366 length:678 start_codon:yes stop_codon:yes gene_type:complete
MAIVEDLGITYVSNFMPSFGGSFVMTIVWGLVIGLLLAVLIWWVLNLIQFKYGANIWVRRGNNLLVSKTVPAKLVRKFDDKTLSMFIGAPFKKKIAVPGFEFILPSTDKRFREGIVNILKIDEETFTPIEVRIVDDNVRLVPLANKLNSIRALDKELQATFSAKDFWAQHGAMVVQMASLVLIIGAIFIITVMQADNFQAINGAASAIRDAVEQLNNCRVAGSTF